jgi:subtilisin family serine protease
VLHSAAAGHAGADTVDFPASLSQVLAVGAVTRWGSVASFSNRGEALEFVAPGQIVLCPDRPGPSGYHPGDFVCLNGTSFASPFVAGIAALALSVDPALSRGQLVSILRNSTRDLGQVGWDPSHGWGLPQADLVVDAARHPGDLDRNGMVNATDLAMLLSRWGDVGPTGDLDGDGLVGASDLAILLADWTG